MLQLSESLASGPNLGIRECVGKPGPIAHSLCLLPVVQRPSASSFPRLSQSQVPTGEKQAPLPRSEEGTIPDLSAPPRGPAQSWVHWEEGKCHGYWPHITRVVCLLPAWWLLAQIHEAQTSSSPVPWWRGRT